MRNPIFAVFNADGTLLDTMEYHRVLAAECIVKYFGTGTGINFDRALDEYDGTTGIPFPEQLETIFPDAKFREKRSLCAAEYISRKAEEVYGKAAVFADVREGVSYIIQAGITSSVSTSTERDLIYNVLERESVNEFFEAVRGLEDGSKPDHFQTIRKKYNPKRIFFIGDSLHDVGLHERDVITIGRYGEEPGMHPREELLDGGASFATNDFRNLLEFMSDYFLRKS